MRDSEAGDVVAAATDADLQVVLTGGADRGDDIADRGTPDDQLRAVIDHPIPDRPGGSYPRVPGVSVAETGRATGVVCAEFAVAAGTADSG